MASGGPPYDDYKARNLDYKPKSNRRPPRYGTSYEAELSLNSELQRSESEERRSLPNNLVCVFNSLALISFCKQSYRFCTNLFNFFLNIIS